VECERWGFYAREGRARWIGGQVGRGSENYWRNRAGWKGVSGRGWKMSGGGFTLGRAVRGELAERWGGRRGARSAHGYRE